MRHAMTVLAVSVCLLTGGMSGAWAADKSGVLKASHLIGMKVQGTDGKKLGDIKDLVVDPADGDIDYAVLDFGGFLGIGDKYFAVPWEAIQWTPDGKYAVLDVTKRDLKQAPGFDKNHWPDLTSRDQAVVIYEFYGVPMTEESPGHKQAPH